MEITLYNFSKRRNSTKTPNENGTLVNVRLKSAVSIYSPTFLLQQANVDSYTYCKWGDRYYYINDIVKDTIENVWLISCSLDSLATYKAQINATSAFTLYSTQLYNSGIVDTRLSSKLTAEHHHNDLNLFTEGNGVYCLTYITNQNVNHGAVGTVWINQSRLTELAGIVQSTAFHDHLVDLPKLLSSCADSLIDCKYIPIDESIVYGTRIFLSNYDSGIMAGVPHTITRSGSVTIPWQYSDFRNGSRFTSLYMFLPAYGYIELNPDNYIGKTSISITMTVDGVTGDCTYIVGDNIRCTTRLSQNLPVGTMGANDLSALTSMAGATVSAMAGNIVGAGLNIFNAVTSALGQHVGVVGSSGGIASILTAPTNYGTVRLVAITHDTTVAPSTMADRHGRPLNEVRQMSNLIGGYAQTVDFSIECNAPDQIKEEINAYMNGGVYLE